MHLLKDTTVVVLCSDGAKGTLLAPPYHSPPWYSTRNVCVFSSADFQVHGNNEAMTVVLLHAYVGQTMYESSWNGISISPRILARRYLPDFFVFVLLHHLLIMEC